MTDEPNLPAQRRPAELRPLPPPTDEQRERVIDELRRHCGVGQLTLDDFADRAGRVWAAPTSMELDAIVADLPDLSVALPVTPSATPIVGATRRRKVRKWIVAVMSGSNPSGRWRVGDQVNAVAVMGGIEMDLRDAEIDGDELHVVAVAVMGGIEVIVPEGIDVELGGFAFMGGKDARLAAVPVVPGAPRIRVTAFALMGGVEVRSRRPQAEIDAARKARKVEQIERRAQRAIERANRALDAPRPPRPPRPPRGGALRGEQRDLGKVIKREIGAILHEQLDQALGAAHDPHDARTARPSRPSRRDDADRWVTTDDDAAAVRRRLKRNGRPEGTVTIMFTDIESSTELTERLGDEDAAILVKEHNELVRAQVAACGGYEVKFRGDGFMLAFTSAAKSVRCAIAIQETMRSFAERHPEAPMAVCIGINSGEAVPDGDDFLGTAVNIAARLADAAAGGEVLVSSVVRDLCASTGEFKFLPEQQLPLKGISEPQRTCLVTW